jgi:hypothetical protein
MDDERRRIHEMVDQLPESQLATVAGLLENLFDDEPVTEEDRKMIAEGEAWLAAGGKCTTMEDLLAEYGLKLSDFPLKK